jgi:transcriptional regulator with XRE-family HTH domain
MTQDNPSLLVRGKMLGVLLRDARQVRNQTRAACADAAGIDPATYEAFETGATSPSLPELELLAYFLDVPLSYFWAERVLSEQSANGHQAVPAEALAELRHRIIGAQVRQARHAAGLALPDLAARLGVSPEQLAAHELGQWPIPLPALEDLAARLNLAVDHFFEAEGPVGERDSLLRASARLRELPSDLREFVSQPANEDYLRLAQKLSQMPLGQLRAIAESLLEITL